MSILRMLFICSLFLLSGTASAEVVLSRVSESNPDWRANPYLYITGEINQGDYEKALNGVREAFEDGDLGQLFVRLDSPGGDVLEAMKIGGLVRDLNLTTSVLLGKCNSACVFILLAGSERLSGSGIGIHRPFFDKEYFSELSITEAQNEYEFMMSETTRYLEKMGATKEFIERMYRIPSNEIEKLSLEDVQKWISGTPASLDEWLIAKCGSYTRDEGNDYAMWLAKRIDLKPGYAEYLKTKVNKVEGCRMVTLSNERKRVAKKLFPDVREMNMPNKTN